MAPKKPYKLNKWQEKWLQALETKKYPKGKEALAQRAYDADNDTYGEIRGYCCLGVAVMECGTREERNKLAGDDIIENPSNLYEMDTTKRRLKLNGDNGEFLGVDGEERSDLTECNDGKKWGDCKKLDRPLPPWSHPKIAAFIRKNPHKVFRDAR